MSISSHKIEGPKGNGVCYIHPHVVWEAQIEGTTHEKGFRPGTVDVPSIMAFTHAAQLIVSKQEENKVKYQELRRRFEKGISRLKPTINIQGKSDPQLPSIIGFTISGIQGQYVMLECNRYGVAISTGSACQVGQQRPSRTMLSMGKDDDEAKQFVRVSLGSGTEAVHIDKLLDALQKILIKYQ